MSRIALAVSAALLSTVAVSAADLIIPTTPQPIYSDGGFDWDGLYIGVRAGGQWFTAASFGAVGGVVGANMQVTDMFVLGAEVSGDYTWNDVTTGAEFFANVRAGALVTDAALLYGLAGTGIYTSGGNSVGLYQLGGGVEFAVTDAVTVRGEVVGQGNWGGARLFNSVKATAGVSYHF